MNLTINEIRELAGIQNEPVAANPCPWKIGKNYLIRTVTMIQTGRLVAVHPAELVLEEAAWIPDTGRWADALEKGAFNEVEPFPAGQVIVGRGCVIDAVLLMGELPRSQK